jgi:GNAT superfamily N-acetyltransferase
MAPDDETPTPPEREDLASAIRTRQGAILQLRPIRPDDGPGLIDFHATLSATSTFRRFFSVHPRLSPREVEHFTTVDYVNRLALVVEDEGRLVAVARYDRPPDSTEAEVAFVVADAYHDHGIATLLLEHLVDAALTTGITSFCALTLAENREMLGVFTASGFAVTTSHDDGTVTVRFSIEPDEESEKARRHRHQ